MWHLDQGVNADTSARMSFILTNASFSGGPNSNVLAAGLCLMASVKGSSTSAACGINFL